MRLPGALGLLLVMAVAIPQATSAHRHRTIFLSIAEARSAINRAHRNYAATHPELTSWRIYGCSRVSHTTVNCEEEAHWSVEGSHESTSSTSACTTRVTVTLSSHGFIRFHFGSSSCSGSEPSTTPSPPSEPSSPSTSPSSPANPPQSFSCPTEAGVTKENDCPPPNPANPPLDFCTTHQCIPNFANGHGTAVQCNDGMWSDSGGIQGACSYHGGESNNPPGPPPSYASPPA